MVGIGDAFGLTFPRNQLVVGRHDEGKQPSSAAIKQSRRKWLYVVDTVAIEEEEGFRRCK
jgi:hypothetical protein